MKKNNLKLLTALILSLSSSFIYAETQVIKFATEATYPPFEYVDAAGKMRGFDIDVVKAICKEIKAKCPIANQPFDSLIPSLQLRKYDAIIGAINITAEREKQVDFTQPYYLNTASIVAAKVKNLTLEPEILRGKTIGVQGGTTFGSYLQEKYGNTVKINYYASEQSAFMDLTSGRIDAVMGDTPLVQQWLKKKGGNTYAIVGMAVRNEKYFGKGYGIAVGKGNKQLLQLLNQGIDAIKQKGILDKLQQKYFFNVK